MPTYHYRCKDCDHEFDVVRSMAEEVGTHPCSECHGEASQVIGVGRFASYGPDGAPVHGFAGPDVRMRPRDSLTFSSQRKIYPVS